MSFVLICLLYLRVELCRVSRAVGFGVLCVIVLKAAIEGRAPAIGGLLLGLA